MELILKGIHYLIDDIILYNSRCFYTTDGRLAVYNYKLATKLNKYLKHYDSGKYKFLPGEEAIFKVPTNKIDYVLKTYLTKRPRG